MVTDFAGVDLETVRPATGRTAYRIVQEGLTNVRKHAPGRSASVTIAGGPGDGLEVEVRNRWPVGTSTSADGGTGLIGVRERASLAGGRLEHGRTADGDFRLAAWLPWIA